MVPLFLYLVPAQAVIEMPVVDSAVNWFASLIPSIARWVELSPFQYNTKLFAVFFWGMVPVEIYWLITSKEIKRNYQEAYIDKSTQQTAVVRLATFFAGIVFLEDASYWRSI